MQIQIIVNMYSMVLVHRGRAVVSMEMMEPGYRTFEIEEGAETLTIRALTEEEYADYNIDLWS